MRFKVECDGYEGVTLIDKSFLGDLSSELLYFNVLVKKVERKKLWKKIISL